MQEFSTFFRKLLDNSAAAATSRLSMKQLRPGDAELVAKVQAGDHEAFAQLYDRHAAMVRAVVLAVSGDWHAIDDMAQESFLRAYRKLATLREPALFGQWITGIARRVAREHRRSQRRDRHELRDPHSPGIESRAAAAPDVPGRDHLELVMRRLAELPERERLAIHAFFLEERDARDASELLGISRSGFYALVQRAIARLAARVRPCQIADREK
jgi:RNA polymerase sigma-70 factor (ECF subfamily)